MLPIWQAFWRLNTERPIGPVAGPIPWRAVAAYADELTLAGDAREEFYDAIAAMDSEFMDWAAAKTKASGG